MRRGALVVPLLFLALAVPADAQVNSCGEGFELFMRNPDLQPRNDGKFHVSGDFFVQFQVIGAEADQIETFAFSVGLPPELPEEICTLPAWPTGLMLEAYKVDQDKEDGFFILMNTKGQSTPQNTDLTVAVHAYDAAGTEVARFWGVAVVESCPGQTGGCAASETSDTMMPWPVMLPGDGAKTYVDGFSIEFAEELAEFAVFLNGEDVTDQMEPWAGRLWDADTFYDYGPAGIFAEVAPMCTLPAPAHQCVQSPGPAYQWTRRAITDSDVIRVEATDLAGNVAQKEIHVGSSVAGGTISDDLPIITMTFVEDQVVAAQGGTAVFQARMENTGGGTGHPFVEANVPDNWTFEWTPGHKAVEPGTTEIQELNVVVPLGTQSGIYPVTALVKYRQGNNDIFLESTLEVLVDGTAAADDFAAAGDEPEEDVKESPGIAIMSLLAVLAVAVLRRR